VCAYAYLDKTCYLKHVDDFISNPLYPQTCSNECHIGKHLQAQRDAGIHMLKCTCRKTPRYHIHMLAKTARDPVQSNGESSAREESSFRN